MPNLIGQDTHFGRPGRRGPRRAAGRMVIIVAAASADMRMDSRNRVTGIDSRTGYIVEW